MQNIITNYGKNIALSELQNKVNKYVLIGANTADDANLDKLLSKNLDIITDYNIDTATNEVVKYIISDIKDIDSSIVDLDKRLIFTIRIGPDDLPEKKYVYAIALLDDKKNIYSVNRFSQAFNELKDAGEVITIKHAILSDEIQERNQVLKIFDNAKDFVTRDEFIFWLENHNHDDATVSLRKFTDAINKLNTNKVDKNTIGNIDLVNSADNSNIVNILNEMIANIGNIPNLSEGRYSNIVEAINDVVVKMGKSNTLNFIANDIYDALNSLYHEIDAIKNIKFADNIKVKEVNWNDKANIGYVGSLDQFSGNTRSNIVEALNEVYDKVLVKTTKTPAIIDALGRYSFYTTPRNSFSIDTYHIMFYPEDANRVDGYVYIILEVINTPLLSVSGFNAPTVNIKYVQSVITDGSENMNFRYGDWDNLQKNKYNPYGITVKAGCIADKRIVELEFTKLGRVVYWATSNNVEVELNYNGNPLSTDEYSNSYINHIVRNQGGDLAWQDIGNVYTYTTDNNMHISEQYNNGFYDITAQVNITLRKDVESLAFKKFGGTYKLITTDRTYFRLF